MKIAVMTINTRERETEVRIPAVGMSDLSGLEDFLRRYYPDWTSAVVVVVPEDGARAS